ncbi:MAG: GNAT family N-acetyltransferase [Treponema sp.]|nr:GNAT family N-acetyltransferase [Treponema sp.]
MEPSVIHDKAERIRDVIRYIQRFKNAIIVIYLDDKLIDSPLFLRHIKDISLLHETGLKVIIVPGAAKRIDEILTSSGIHWTMHRGCRITRQEAMPLIKMAAFDVSNRVMTALAGEKITALIGNWVRARGRGVIDGLDYGTIGEIDKLQTEAIETVLQSGFIPIFPCIGWSLAGKPYNISSILLSQQIAIHLHADKLFYLVPGASISSEEFKIPNSLGISPEGTVPAMNLEEVDEFLKINEYSVNSENSNNYSVNSAENSGKISHRSVNSTENLSKNAAKTKILSLLNTAKEACSSGVTRVHILNGSLDGTVPCEIFSDFGSGTMIYTSNYGRIREMKHEDIQNVLTLMQPFIDKGILLPRTPQMLSDQYSHYIVYELDGAIRACSSLVPYSDGQMEIAGVAVDSNCSHMGIGPKMIEYLIDLAQKKKATGLFLLTTQTSDWFENLGFEESDISSLPEQRKASWSPKRGSKVLRFNISK